MLSLLKLEFQFAVQSCHVGRSQFNSVVGKKFNFVFGGLGFQQAFDIHDLSFLVKTQELPATSFLAINVSHSSNR